MQIYVSLVRVTTMYILYIRVSGNRVVVLKVGYSVVCNFANPQAHLSWSAISLHFKARILVL